MIIFETHIPNTTLEFFQNNIKSLFDYNEINSLIRKVSGINNFFTLQSEATKLSKKIKDHSSVVAEPNRREYGDFQTNVMSIVI